jgi:hypothetical protein
LILLCFGLIRESGSLREEGKTASRGAGGETIKRLGRHFANPAARASAGAYLQSLLSSVKRKNSWQLAEAAGLETPYRFQHLQRARDLGRRRVAR